MLFYVPSLDPYPGYSPIRTESLDDTEYVELPGGEQVCPERHVNIFSSMYFFELNVFYSNYTLNS